MIEQIITKILKNKKNNSDYLNALEKHNTLIKSYNQAIKQERAALVRAAFGKCTGELIYNPKQALIWAVKTHNKPAALEAARAAYETNSWGTLQQAGRYLPEVNALVDFLQSYGELQNINQTTFLAAILEPPGERKKNNG